MGRAHEVRAASMAATNARKSALYMKASSEIYLAAKSGTPDPRENLALRSAIEKWKAQDVTREVIERAIVKAKGGSADSYEAGRYEAFGPGGTAIVINTLTDNNKRAFANVRAAVTHHGGTISDRSGSAAFHFEDAGVIEFVGNDVDALTETLILNEVDVKEVKQVEDNVIRVLVSPKELAKAKDVLNQNGVEKIDVAETKMIPVDVVDLDGEEKQKLKNLLDALDEVEDVQSVFHNANI